MLQGQFLADSQTVATFARFIEGILPERKMGGVVDPEEFLGRSIREGEDRHQAGVKQERLVDLEDLHHVLRRHIDVIHGQEHHAAAGSAQAGGEAVQEAHQPLAQEEPAGVALHALQAETKGVIVVGFFDRIENAQVVTEFLEAPLQGGKNVGLRICPPSLVHQALLLQSPRQDRIEKVVVLSEGIGVQDSESLHLPMQALHGFPVAVNRILWVEFLQNPAGAEEATAEVSGFPYLPGQGGKQATLAGSTRPENGDGKIGQAAVPRPLVTVSVASLFIPKVF